jgi:hypothetical protein
MPDISPKSHPRHAGGGYALGRRNARASPRQVGDNLDFFRAGPVMQHRNRHNRHEFTPIESETVQSAVA